MERDVLLRYLRAAARQGYGDDAIDVLPEVWSVFSNVENEWFRREIYLLNTLPLGRGSFGIVFAVIVATFRDSSGTIFFSPAAMKVSPVLRDHIPEVANALGVNELMIFGCTPGLPYLHDAFAISTSLDACQMPPPSWKSFWRTFDLFIFNKMDEIKRLYGDDAIANSDPVTQTARVNRGYTVGFKFYELSPHTLVTSAEKIVKLQPSIRDKHDGNKALAHLYTIIQACSALHMAEYLHGDIHMGNILESMMLTHRPPLLWSTLYHPDSIQDRLLLNSQLGATDCGDDFKLPPKGKGVALRQTSYAFLNPPLAEYTRNSTVAGQEARNHAVVIDTPTIPLLSDIGSMMTAMLPRAMTNKTDIFDRLNAHHTLPDNGRLSTHVISNRPFRYLNYAAGGGGCGGGDGSCFLPLMTPIRGPTTNIFARPHEHLNPMVWRSASTTVTHVLGVYSELSDVNSLATTLVSRLLGFDIFSTVIPMALRACGKGEYWMGLPIDPRFSERHCNGVSIYRLASAFGTHFSESRPLLNQSSSDGYDLSKSLHRSTHETAKAQHLETMVYSDYAYVRWGQIYYAPTGNGKKSLFSLVSDYLHSFNAFEAKTPLWPWFNELEHCIAAIVLRIEALGLPRDVEAHKGTLLYELFRNLEGIYGSRAHEGWLERQLRHALTDKYGLDLYRAQDLLRLLMDALDWDPAQRPTAEVMLTCPIFAALYQRHADISEDATRYWSAHRPSPATWPLQAANNALVPLAQLDWKQLNVAQYFGAPVNQRWPSQDTLIGGLRGALYRHFIDHYTALPGFMTVMARRHLPLLHPSDSEIVAVINFNTGLLDYHTGEPCMNYQHHVPTLFHMDGLLAHCKDPNHFEAYIHTLVFQETRRQAPTPAWVFLTPEAFAAVPEAVLSNNLRQSYDVFFQEGKRMDDIAPKVVVLQRPRSPMNRPQRKPVSPQRHHHTRRPYQQSTHPQRPHRAGVQKYHRQQSQQYHHRSAVPSRTTMVTKERDHYSPPQGQAVNVSSQRDQEM